MADVQVDLKQLLQYQASVAETQRELRQFVKKNIAALEDCERQRRSLQDKIALMREWAQRDLLDAEYLYRASVAAAEKSEQPLQQPPGSGELSRLGAAQKRLTDIEACERQLNEQCSTVSNRVTELAHGMSDAMGTYCRFAVAGDQALNRYMQLVMRAEENDNATSVHVPASVSMKNSSSQSSIAAGGASLSEPVKHSTEKQMADSTKRYSAIFTSPEGKKQLTVQTVSGPATLPLKVSALAQHYQKAKNEGDIEAMRRFQAIYELEWFRKSLDLQTADAPIGRLAGYYGDMSGKRPGYHAHHIPAQAIQARDKKELPAIYLSPAEHRLTDSYAGKMNSVYRSFLPDAPVTEQYAKEAVIMIEEGRYTELVRLEILNLRDQFGTTVDAGISQLIDTIEDMIARQGICGANPDYLRGARPKAPI